jgi:ATP-dependent DNA ligase
MLFAFDLLELDGVNYCPLPLSERKEQLARLVDRRLVALANKMARVAWALLARGGKYRPPAIAAAA